MARRRMDTVSHLFYSHGINLAKTGTTSKATAFHSLADFKEWYLKVKKIMWEIVRSGGRWVFMSEPTEFFICRLDQHSTKLSLHYNKSIYYYPGERLAVQGYELAGLDPYEFPVWDEDYKKYSVGLKIKYNCMSDPHIKKISKALEPLDLERKKGRAQWPPFFSLNMLNYIATTTMSRLAPEGMDLGKNYSRIQSPIRGFFGFRFRKLSRIYPKRKAYCAHNHMAAWITGQMGAPQCILDKLGYKNLLKAEAAVAKDF